MPKIFIYYFLLFFLFLNFPFHARFPTIVISIYLDGALAGEQDILVSAVGSRVNFLKPIFSYIFIFLDLFTKTELDLTSQQGLGCQDYVMLAHSTSKIRHTKQVFQDYSTLFFDLKMCYTISKPKYIHNFDQKCLKNRYKLFTFQKSLELKCPKSKIKFQNNDCHLQFEINNFLDIFSINEFKYLVQVQGSLGDLPKALSDTVNLQGRPIVKLAVNPGLRPGVRQKVRPG